MSYVACIVVVAPLRKEATHRSEMISQLLLGEIAEVLESTRDFLFVRCLYDDYEGWCQRKQLEKLDEIPITDKFLYEGIQNIRLNKGNCRISMGTPIYGEAIQFKTTQIEYNIDEKYTGCPEFNSDSIVRMASEYINTPYLWGGKSIFGIDCSGFTQQLFKLFDIKLPRDAWQQAESGELVGFLQQVHCGDLAFFDNEEGKITHVGLLLDSQNIIHSSGKVRSDKIDNEGIINVETGERTHHLRIIKRYKELN